MNGTGIDIDPNTARMKMCFALVYIEEEEEKRRMLKKGGRLT